jgi:hypothetical protein
MKCRIECIDWFATVRGKANPQKAWSALLSEIEVLDISDRTVADYDFENVLLLVVHNSVKGRTNYEHVEHLLRIAVPAPYVMFVSTQPRKQSERVQNNGRWNETGVPFPESLAHLSEGFQKLVARLAGIERSSDAPDIVQRRVQAWDEWEKFGRLNSKPALSTLSFLCQGYLATHGGTGLDGWTAELQRRVNPDSHDMSKRAWWIEDIFESGAELQKAVLGELGVPTIMDLPDGIRDLVNAISCDDDKGIERAVVQSAFQTLMLIQGQK